MRTLSAVTLSVPLALALSVVTAAQVSVQAISGTLTARVGTTVQQTQAGPAGGEAHASSSYGTADAYGTIYGLGIFCHVEPRPTSGLSARAQSVITARYTAPAPVAGHLRIDLDTGAVGIESAGVLDVDVGADGSWETLVVGPRFMPDIPAVVTPAGLDVVVRADFFIASGSPSIIVRPAIASVVFRETPTVLQTHLVPCGVELGAYRAPAIGGERLRYDGVSAQPVQAAFMLLGVSRTSIPLPPLGCELGVQSLVSVPMAVSPAGATSMEVTLLDPLPSATLYMQLLYGELVGPAVEWRLSNVVQTDT